MLHLTSVYLFPHAKLASPAGISHLWNDTEKISMYGGLLEGGGTKLNLSPKNQILELRYSILSTYVVDNINTQLLYNFR
jgi:hypothetical protein